MKKSSRIFKQFVCCVVALTESFGYILFMNTDNRIKATR